MIVYYIAPDEKPKNTNGVRFFSEHSVAHAAASEARYGVYQFEVNDKCDSDNFGLDTILVFKKEQDGSLKFIASGQWLDIHEVLNIPFYYDFEKPGSSYVSMSLKYFNLHYTVTERKEGVSVAPEQSKPKQVEKPMPVPKKAPVSQNKVPEKAPVVQEKKEEKKDVKQADEDVLAMLFGGG